VAAVGKPEWRTQLERKPSAPAATMEEVQAALAHATLAAATVDGTKASAASVGRAVDHNIPMNQTEEARADHFATTVIHLGAIASHHR
jgi:hypothetical protein